MWYDGMTWFEAATGNPYYGCQNRAYKTTTAGPSHMFVVSSYPHFAFPWPDSPTTCYEPLGFFARVKFPNVIALPNGLSKSRLPLKSNGLSEKNIVLHIKIAIELKVNPPVLDTENLSHTQGQDP